MRQALWCGGTAPEAGVLNGCLSLPGLRVTILPTGTTLEGSGMIGFHRILSLPPESPDFSDSFSEPLLVGDCGAEESLEPEPSSTEVSVWGTVPLPCGCAGSAMGPVPLLPLAGAWLPGLAISRRVWAATGDFSQQ